MEEQLKYKIAISMIPGIGSILARNLIAYTGSVEGIFNEKTSVLKKIPGIGEINAKKISDPQILINAENEIEFIQKNNIKTFFYADKDYPRRLSQCPDAPIILFGKGNFNLDTEKIISIVGTRNATDYGKEVCENLTHGLSEQNHNVLIISGLAYGIDIQAHKMALKYNLPTIGVLGHGLDRLYPSLHNDTAKKMLDNGGLISDFPSNTKIDPPNFIRRNRIIAGLADATIVIESGVKGGALITAEIASSYNRDVFAIPGNIGSKWSMGCNKLIKNNGATLIESVSDLEYFMGWEENDNKPKTIQKQLFLNLSPEEEIICNLLKENEPVFIDEICSVAELPMGKVSGLLLNLEFKGIVSALPGKMYKLR
ncbi:MAG: DNA-processing protein DprA [Prolixibacteraceae bacterium]|nr:DNA-processing protein DprA [Prolixibacteraceae bacterium]MBN2772712.1 DNA-processing protein DprA [Prolixibacteraceae bacterium]